jgi:D-alanyl-D-alanine carboxypeptidase (penicillin-binding protein 5/6)
MKPTRIARCVLAATLAVAIPSVPLAAPGRPVLNAAVTAAPVSEEVPIVLLADLSTGQTLFAREPDRRFVPASVTKVMTAYTAFKLIEAGKLDPGMQLVVSQEIDEKWSGEGSSMFLKAGDRVTVGQLLLGVTTVSGNDAAVMLGTTAAGSLDKWLDMMNANAADLGMRNTHFATPNGWPDEGRTYTSARDLAILAEAMTSRYPGLYHRYVGHHGMSYRNITQANHDPITGVVAGADGIKTGYTRQAGYNFLGSAERNGRRLVMVIAGAPTPSARNQTARALLNWGFDAFHNEMLLPAETVVGEARVQGGARSRVALRTRAPVMASVPPGAQLKAEMSIRYRGPLGAPIAQDSEVGTLRVTIPGQQPHDVPLVAAQSVPRANLLQQLGNGLAGLFT